MQTCPHCGKENRETDSYCYSCGHILASALSTLEVQSSTRKLDDVYESLEPRRRWGTAFFDQRSRLELKFRDSGQAMLLEVPHRIVLGRAHDEADVSQPDVDLAPYLALEQGVSRRHLELRRDHETIKVVDMDSANGTFLNGQRLIPGEPRILRDNDELRLGRLVFRVAYV